MSLEVDGWTDTTFQENHLVTCLNILNVQIFDLVLNFWKVILKKGKKRFVHKDKHKNIYSSIYIDEKLYVHMEVTQ